MYRVSSPSRLSRCSDDHWPYCWSVDSLCRKTSIRRSVDRSTLTSGQDTVHEVNENSLSLQRVQELLSPHFLFPYLAKLCAFGHDVRFCFFKVVE
jgi:hypothetical protein